MKTFWVMIFMQFSGTFSDGWGNINLFQQTKQTYESVESCEKALIPVALNHEGINFSVQRYGDRNVKAVENKVNDGSMSTYTVLKCVKIHQ